MTWFDSNWTYRAKVTIDSTKVDGDLTDYPVFLRLADFGSGHGIWGNVKTDGSDLRVTTSDETTEVPIEVVDIDTTAKTGEVYFKASGTLSSSADTDFWVYYGNSGASAHAEDATNGRENVWKSSFKGVWHLNEANNTTANGYLDSTSTDNDGTGVSMNLTEQTGVVSATAAKFDGSNDYIDCGNDSSTRPTGDFSITCLCKAANWDLLQSPFSSGVSSSNRGIGFFIHSSTNECKYVQGDGTNKSWLYLVVNFPGNFINGQWHTVTNVKDGTTGRAYVDGVQKDSETGINSIQYSETVDCNIGKHGNYEFIGEIDEVRLNAEAESAEWIDAVENNLRDSSNFYTIGSEEEDEGGGAADNAVFYGCNF